MKFLVALIRHEPTAFLRENATHVVDDYWLYEGLLPDLSKASDVVLGLAEVPSLGGMSQEDLIALCRDSFERFDYEEVQP